MIVSNIRNVAIVRGKRFNIFFNYIFAYPIEGIMFSGCPSGCACVCAYTCVLRRGRFSDRLAVDFSLISNEKLN